MMQPFIEKSMESLSPQLSGQVSNEDSTEPSLDENVPATEEQSNAIEMKDITMVIGLAHVNISIPVKYMNEKVYEALNSNVTFEVVTRLVDSDEYEIPRFILDISTKAWSYIKETRPDAEYVVHRNLLVQYTFGYLVNVRSLFEKYVRQVLENIGAALSQTLRAYAEEGIGNLEVHDSIGVTTMQVIDDKVDALYYITNNEMLGDIEFVYVSKHFREEAKRPRQQAQSDPTLPISNAYTILEDYNALATDTKLLWMGDDDVIEPDAVDSNLLEIIPDTSEKNDEMKFKPVDSPLVQNNSPDVIPDASEKEVMVELDGESV